MDQILIYSDSLTWGIIPNTLDRLAFDKRWPGVFENALIRSGKAIRAIENCLNGRRTVWPDPFKEGRNGAEGLAQVIEMHCPLTLVILMLGTNDFQRMHDNNAWLSAQGAARLVQIIRQAPIELSMPIPEVMIVAPPVIKEPKGTMTHKFRGAEKKCIGLADELETVAKEYSAWYFDAGGITDLSTIDGIHLDADQHRALGEALAQAVTEWRIL